MGEQSERFNRIRELAVSMAEKAKQDAAKDIRESEEAVNYSLSVFRFTGIAALLLAAFITYFLNRIIANPLKEISLTAGRIASGDLDINVTQNDRKDEVGVLINTFSRMTTSLSEKANVARQIAASDLTVIVKPASEKDVLGKSFSIMIDNLRTITKDIMEGINTLSSSASEILASTTQVASGAAETATAVSETTATVEEVKQTSHMASQKAKSVADTALNAKTVSSAGKKSVDETIEAMSNINEQMESVAETIVKLSEQSQTIGEIIATVNNLAEQSNLLAVNAAIEAAKAGDQGKGFSVVAQEVKNLADQSKQATTQVRTILNDIQKTISTAVMATEQGSKAVKTGVEKSKDSGDSIKVLADSISESAQAASQIFATSQQQLVGMDQVAQAMEEIKKSSIETSASTKQAEIAAKNLHDLGMKLKSAIDRYKV
jgi:methyl-accepting chemotaxis protein